MPRKFLKRFLPDHASVRGRRELRFLGRLLDDPNLLHLNRRSVSGATAVGLFAAFIPTPGQMLIAAALAILFRVNLVIAAALVWLTNPITMPPVFYFCYRVGTALLGSPIPAHFTPELEWFWHSLDVIWQPFLLGCLVVGLVSAGAGYLLVRGLWTLHVRLAYGRRKRRRSLD